MATLVEKGNGDSVDLSELTDGELSLLGMLKSKYKFYGGHMHYASLQVGQQSLSSMSNISEVRIDIKRENQTGLGGYVDAFGSQLTTVGNHIISSFTNNRIRYNKNSSSSGEPDTDITIISFTTKDGKVHTADNLNY